MHFFPDGALDGVLVLLVPLALLWALLAIRAYLLKRRQNRATHFPKP